ncbi:FAD-dependent oxidoreductase [Herbivorax sp. ANBcel31]|uniref:NAD(P)/FAD-dependent oxidoreductase n=1 Tax=Herbivorax sp. ANBcel31 TaxID=3069754 RepID=UPI0027B71E0F|nr:FAD-dependent oxidoreductase [Herbivorax sp. ANBcel31]MDQ2085572.1 FAD-dependent oxidoreductase [Herbivorax sp. ANBcel31]
MKVAIIGAGLAGLSCAHELEKHGITPVIFERNSFIGDQYGHISAFLEIQHRPIKDAIKYFKKQFDLNINSVNTINNLTHYSPNKKTVIEGKFGYFIKRGRGKDALFSQIHSQLKKPNIKFNTLADYEPLSREFDFVVAANGSASFTKELGCWHETIKTYVKGATILGNFDPNTLVMWINKAYCKNGYAYLTPYNEKKASLILVVSEVNVNEVDYFWELFWNTENFNYTIVEEFKQRHETGYAYPHRVGNIYLAGNAGGSIDPFLGFGQLSSITMGVMAARSMVLGKDYEKMIKNVIIRHNQWIYEMRKSFNNADNKMYDIIVSGIGLPGIKHLFYHTKFNVIRFGYYYFKLKSILKK